jgi:hypothetical protein
MSFPMVGMMICLLDMRNPAASLQIQMAVAMNVEISHSECGLRNHTSLTQLTYARL